MPEPRDPHLGGSESPSKSQDLHPDGNEPPPKPEVKRETIGGVEVLLTMEDVMKITRCSRRKLQMDKKKKKLGFVTLGDRSLRFKPSQVRDYIEGNPPIDESR